MREMVVGVLVTGRNWEGRSYIDHDDLVRGISYTIPGPGAFDVWYAKDSLP